MITITKNDIPFLVQESNVDIETLTFENIDVFNRFQKRIDNVSSFLKFIDATKTKRLGVITFIKNGNIIVENGAIYIRNITDTTHTLEKYPLIDFSKLPIYFNLYNVVTKQDGSYIINSINCTKETLNTYINVLTLLSDSENSCVYVGY